MINWKVRFKNPVFWAQVAMAAITPILAYLGLTTHDLTTWTKLGEVLLQAVMNPYVLFITLVSIYNAVVDPTTAGFGDSKRALTYDLPAKNVYEQETSSPDKK